MKNNYIVGKTKLLHITIFPNKSKNKLKKTPLILKSTLKRADSWFMKIIRGFQSLKKKIRGFMKNKVWKQICGLEERARIREQ